MNMNEWKRCHATWCMQRSRFRTKSNCTLSPSLTKWSFESGYCSREPSKTWQNDSSRLFVFSVVLPVLLCRPFLLCFVSPHTACHCCYLPMCFHPSGFLLFWSDPSSFICFAFAFDLFACVDWIGPMHALPGWFAFFQLTLAWTYSAYRVVCFV